MSTPKRFRLASMAGLVAIAMSVLACAPVGQTVPGAPTASSASTSDTLDIYRLMGKTPPFEQPNLDNLVGTVDSTYTLIPCSQREERQILKGRYQLDPSCVYTSGFEIRSSDTILDCRGASIRAGDKKVKTENGIHIRAEVDEDLSHITVRNCRVEGFANNLRVTRFKANELKKDHEYEHNFSDVQIENSAFVRSENTGVFIDAFVSGVSLKRIQVVGSGGPGIYINAGAKGNSLEDSYVHKNGYETLGDFNMSLLDGWFKVKYRRTGREGLAIDGARENEILRNRFEDNAWGGIFLYKNCGEDQHASGWWERLYGANHNNIEGNTLVREKNGIWVGSRMSQNQALMECSDHAYVRDTRFAIIPDFARNNRIIDNKFVANKIGVRIEDNGTTVMKNRFELNHDQQAALMLGTKYRSNQLKEPVDDTKVADNQVTTDFKINLDRQSPFQYHWGRGRFEFSGNLVNNRPAKFVNENPPDLDPFLFVKSYDVSFSWW